MSISTSQKVDYLWKKVGYGAAKRDVNSILNATQESVASPLILVGGNVWSQSHYIPDSIPATDILGVNVYPTNVPVEISSFDTAARPNRSWNTGLKDWIPPEFGSTYVVKVYVHTSGFPSLAASQGTQLFGAGSGNQDEWFFDYQSGTLNFIGENLPNGIDFTGKSIYISGARYTGIKGAVSPGAGVTHTSLNVTGITSFTNGLDNTLGDPNTGAILVDGGIGIEGNVTVGGGLSVTGDSYFVGIVTFAAGTDGIITFGDTSSDNVVFQADIASNVIPNQNDIYDLGSPTQEWKDLYLNGVANIDTLNVHETLDVAGIATFASNIDANANVDISGTLNVDGQTDLDLVYVSESLDISFNTDIGQHLTVGGQTFFAGIATVSGNAVFSSDVNIAGALDVDGSTTLDAVSVGETFDVAGKSTFNSTVGINTSLNVAGIATFSSGLDVTGISTFTSDIDANANLDVDGRTELDITNISETLNVVGIATFAADVDLNAGLDVDGNTELDATNISETLNVVGNTTLQADLDVDGATELDATNISETLNVVGNTTLQADLDVDGNTELDATNISETLNVVGTTDLNSQVGINTNLNVTGISTFASAVDINSDLDVDGNTELDATNISETLNVVGNTTLQADLDVDGATELDATNISETLNVVGNTTLQADLDVDGATELDATNVSETLNVVGDTTLVNLDVDGNTELDATNISETLNVVGNTTLQADLDVDGATELDATNISETLNVVGNTTLQANLDVDGATELDATNVSETLNVVGNTTLQADLDVDGNTELDATNISETLNVVGDTTLINLDVDGNTELDATNISETLSVVGKSTFQSTVGINTSLNVAGIATFSSGLDITGISTFTSDIDANGNLDVAGNSYFVGVTTFATHVAIGGVISGDSLETSNDADIEGELYVAEDTTIDGSVTVGTDLTVYGDTVLYDLRFSGGGDVEIDSQTEDLYLQAQNIYLGEQSSTVTVDGPINFDSTSYLVVAGVSTFTNNVIFDSTGSIQIPVGNTAQRPTGVGQTFGQIRYNTEISSFEGYGPGGTWGSLGGIKDVDGDTYIKAESSAGADEDTLSFFTAGTEKVSIISNGNLGIGSLVPTKKLDVDGDARITGKILSNDLYLSDYTNNKTYLRAQASGSVELYYDNAKKFETTTQGIEVTGQSVFTGDVNVTGIATATALHLGAEGSAIRVTSDTISGPATFTLDPAGVGDNTGKVIIAGDLQVDGTTTTVNSTTVQIDDKNIELGVGAANDAAANGGGFTIKSGDGDKTFQFEATGDNLGSSENINLATGKSYKINNVEVLRNNQLTVSNVNAAGISTIGILDVTGISTFAGNVDINASLNVTTNLDVDGNADIQGTLDVTGASTFTGVGTFIGDAYVGGNFETNGNTNVLGTLDVTGASTFTGVGTFIGDAYVGGNFETNGNIIGYGSANFSGALSALSLDGDLNELGNTYYVATEGSDSNSGNNINEPFLTVAQALSVATNGDIVNVSAGEYVETCPLVVPEGVTVKGAGLRATTIKPSAATKTKDIFRLNNISTVEDITIKESFYNSADDTGYAFTYDPGANITTRSPYVQRVTVLNRGSITSSSDPYGYDTADSPPTSYVAGRGAKVDGSRVASTSIEAGFLFNEVTFITPNNIGVVATNGARIEYLNCFNYFASTAFIGQSGSVGISSSANVRLKLSNPGVTPSPNDVIKLFDDNGVGIATGTVLSENNSYVTIDGKGTGRFLAVGLGATNDVRIFQSDGITQRATAEAITLADYTMFGAEMRSIGCAFEYGSQGIKADGAGVQLRLFATNFNHVGSGKDFTNDITITSQADEVIELNGGEVSYVSIDQSGNFRVGEAFFVNQETGNVSFAATTYALDVTGDIDITDGTNTANLSATSFRVGNLQFSGNTVSSTSGDVTINPSAFNQTNITGDLDVSGTLTASVVNVTALQQGDTSIAISDTGSNGSITLNTEGAAALSIDNSQNITLSSNLIVDGNSTFNSYVDFASNDYIKVPVGTSAQRPTGVGQTFGQIRYNTDLSTFEGFGAGSAWGSLGGVKDVDGDTYIKPEVSAGSDEDTLYFYANNANVISVTETNTTISNTFTVNAANAYFSTDVEVGDDLTVVDNLYVGDNVEVSDELIVDGESTFNAAVVFNEEVTFESSDATIKVDWDYDDGELRFRDDTKIIVGGLDGSQTEIYQNSSNEFFIDGNTNTDINIRSENFTNIIASGGGPGGNYLARFDKNTGVELYWNGNDDGNDGKKFETTSSGVTVTGTTETDLLNVIGNATVGSGSTTNNVLLANNGAVVATTSDTATNKKFILNAGGVETFSVTAAGAAIFAGGIDLSESNVDGLQIDASGTIGIQRQSGLAPVFQAFEGAGTKNIELKADGSAEFAADIVASRFYALQDVETDRFRGYRTSANGTTLAFRVHENGKLQIGADDTPGNNPKITLDASGSASFAGTLEIGGDVTSSTAGGVEVTSTGTVIANRIGSATPVSYADCFVGRYNGTNTATIKADGSATFAETVKSGTFNHTSTSTTGIELASGGMLSVQRASGSGSSAVFRGYQGATVNSEIKADGSATFASGLTEITSQGSIQLKQGDGTYRVVLENNSQGGLLKARDSSGVETVTIDGADGSAFFRDQIISGNGTSTDGHLTINRIGEHSNQKFIKLVSNSSEKVSVYANGSANFAGSLAVDTNLNVTGISTFVGVSTFVSHVYVGGTLFAPNFSAGGGASIGEDVLTRDIEATRNLVVGNRSTLSGSLRVAGISTFAADVNFESNAYFGDNDKVIMGDGNDLQIYHNGVDSYVRDTATGSLILSGSRVIVKNAADNARMIDAIEGGAVKLLHNNVEKLETLGVGVTVTGTTYTNSLETTGDASFHGTMAHLTWDSTNDKLAFDDYTKLVFGGQDDLQLYHDGSNSFIVDDGAGAIHIRSNAVNIESPMGEKMGVFGENGSVELYHDNSKVFETTNTGATLSGSLTITGDFDLPGTSNGLNWDSTNGSIFIDDMTKVIFGNGGDLEIYHDSFNSYIVDSGAGGLNVRSNVLTIAAPLAGTMAKFTQNDSVELYYNSSKKFETTGVGVTVTGNLAISGDAYFNTSDVYTQNLDVDNNLTVANETLLEGPVTVEGDSTFTGEVTFSGETVEFTTSIEDLYLYAPRTYVGLDTGTVDFEGAITFDSAATLTINCTADLIGALNVGGVATFSNDIDANGNLDVAGTSTFAGNVSLGDNNILYIGDANDLQIYHDANHSYIDETGTGNLKLRTNNFKISNLDESKTSIIATPPEGVELYYDNSKKFETIGVGVTVTGATYTTTLETSGAATFNGDVTSTGTITGAAFAYSGSPTISNNNDLANKAYVDTAVSNLVDSAPGTLDTLNELASALGDDANFSTTVTNSIATKLSLSGGTMTGDIDGGGNKVLFANVYTNESDLPSAVTYHGMFAHVHSTGAGYFAHQGSWTKLANDGDLTSAQSTLQTAIDARLRLDGSDTMTGNLQLGGNDLITTGRLYYQNMWNDYASLPSAANNHGMFAHAHAEGAAYFAHGGTWVRLANQADVPSGITVANRSYNKDTGVFGAHATDENGNQIGPVTSVSEIIFDSETGFNITDAGGGKVFVDLGSSFSPWYVDGQTTLEPDGEESIEIIAGDGIQLTTSNTATGDGVGLSKSLTITALAQGLTVDNTSGGTSIIDPISGVTKLVFDNGTGFNVTDNGNGEAFISLGSAFAPWSVAGQTTLTPDGEEEIEFVAGSGIVITTNNTASAGQPKTITFAATGGGGGGGATTLGELSDVDLTGGGSAALSAGRVLKYNGEKWTPAFDNVGSGGGGGGGGSSYIGFPSDGGYDDGLLGLTDTTLIGDAIDQINQILAKLAPTKPANLSAKTLSISGLYTAKVTADDTTRTDVFGGGTSPLTNVVSDFYDGDNGTLTFIVDDNVDSTINLTTDDDTGLSASGGLEITDDSDPFAGTPGKEGFWKQLSAKGKSSTALTEGAQHKYKMSHSITGETPELTFFIDDPGTTNITGITHDTTAAEANLTYVSGVPSYTSGDSVDVTFNVIGAVGKCYNATAIAQISGSQINSANVAPTGGYTEGDPINGAQGSFTFGNNKFSDGDLTITIRGKNSKGELGGNKTHTIEGRLDSKSNESNRLTAGDGEYPAAGYAGAFDSTIDISTNDELQLLDGKYVYPSTDYSTNLLAGPNYSTGMGGMRYVLFDLGAISAAFDLSLNISATGLQAAGEGITADIELTVRVDGSDGTVGWIDANAAYPGVGSPTNNGDGCVLAGQSTTTRKDIVFGSAPKTGTLYARIGIPNGSTIQITSVTKS